MRGPIVEFTPANFPKGVTENGAIAFLDRDGVIIEDCHYIKNPIDVKLCPGVKELFKYF